MTATVHVFVYYRVPSAVEEVVAPLVDHLLATVATATGVTGRSMQREDDPGTWMEVYESVGDGPAFCRTLARLSAESGLDRMLGSADQRHVERFVETPSCA